MKRSGFKQKRTVPMKRSALRQKAKAKSAGWWQSRCDDLLQDIHKFMFEKCLVCGKKNQVGHHYITKALSSFLRYDFRNLIPLCFSCHFKHHIQSDPYINQTINRVMGQEWVEWIESVRRTPIKTGIKYYQEIHEKLSRILEDYQNDPLTPPLGIEAFGGSLRPFGAIKTPYL